jgi:hypothetical protein
MRIWWREMLAFAAERMMDMEIKAKTGAPAGTRSADRLNNRNGYRERDWDTRAGQGGSSWRSPLTEGQLLPELPEAASYCGESFGDTGSV